MKKIINGKKYDTETATCLDRIRTSVYRNGGSKNVALYLKTTGEFFLYIYEESAYPFLNKYGKKVVPLTEEKAKAWAEDKLSVERYEKIFGEVEE